MKLSAGLKVPAFDCPAFLYQHILTNALRNCQLQHVYDKVEFSLRRLAPEAKVRECEALRVSRVRSSIYLGVRSVAGSGDYCQRIKNRTRQ